MKKFTKIDIFFHWAGTVSLVAGFVLIFYFWYLLCWPVDVLKVNGDLKVLNPNKQVEVGGTLKYEYDYCKYLNLPAVTTIILHNEVLIGLPQRTGNIATGCHKHVTFQKIPDTPLIIGKARLDLTHHYKINAFRDWDEYASTEWFEIVKKK